MEMNWIPCKERLPEKSGEYLVQRARQVSRSCKPEFYLVNFSAAHGKFNCSDWMSEEEVSEFTIPGIVAWMPLPALYESL